MCWFKKEDYIVGFMPTGKGVRFNSLEEYENAYYDALYEFNNGFYREHPEV